MTIHNAIRAFAGSFILISLGLAHASGQADLGRLSWLWFTAFVGANLLQSAFTGFCPLEIALRRLGLRESAAH